MKQQGPYDAWTRRHALATELVDRADSDGDTIATGPTKPSSSPQSAAIWAPFLYKCTFRITASDALA